MPRRNQIIVLVLLASALAFVVYRNQRPQAATPCVAAADQKVRPMTVENSELHVHMLERIRKFEYAGTGRNIFSYTAPPPPVKPTQAVKIGPALPPQPPPLEIPAKFFGYTSDPRAGFRRAFFTNGEDVFIVAEGEVLLRNFRLLRIGNNNAEVEEISSGRRQTLQLEETGPSA